jgi:PAS domain S-box-containing protein
MSKELHILILEDVPADAELIALELRKGGIVFSSRRVETKEDFQKELRDFMPDIILADFSLPAFSGLSALVIVKKESPDVPLILVSGAIGEELAVKMLKEGATDYVLKSRLSHLVPAVNRALREAEERAERKGAEEALRESENKYRALVDNALVGTYKTTLKGDIIYANEALWMMLEFGSSEEMMVEAALKRYKYPEDREVLIEELKEKNKVENFETELLTKTGRTKNVLMNAVLDGDTVSGMIMDITERKRVEEELAKALNEQKNIMDTIPDIIYLLDLNGNLIKWNRKGEIVTGYSSEEIKGKYVLDFFHDKDKPVVIKAIQEAFEKGYRDIEAGLLLKDGTVVPYHWTGVPLKDEQGKVIALIGVGRDITEREKMEEELKKRVKELEEFYDMAVGREIRMIELKKEIESLKEELLKYKKE